MGGRGLSRKCHVLPIALIKEYWKLLDTTARPFKRYIPVNQHGLLENGPCMKMHFALEMGILWPGIR